MYSTRRLNYLFNTLRTALAFGLVASWLFKAYFVPMSVHAADEVAGVLMPLVSPTYAVHIDASQTGISGVCIGCSVSNKNNVTDNDTGNAASITIPVGVGATGSIAVEDTTNTFPAEYFAGFVISDTSGLGTQLLNAITISTFNDGALQETKHGGSLLDAPLFSGQRTIGFTTTKPFDEIRVTTRSVAGLLAKIDIYYAAVRAPIFVTSVVQPAYNVQVDTTIGGTCVLCSVSGANNVIDSDTSNAASINIPVGVTGTGMIAVHDVVNTFPASSFAGFVISDTSGLGTQLLNAVTISTYNDGALQETQTSGNLLDLPIATNQATVGFITTKPFDEIRVTVGSVAGLLANINVYQAVVSQAPSTDNDGDGIPNAVEGTGDVDGDGIPNYQDTDSDGDGIPDSVEAGSTPTNPVDTDGDGTPDYLDTDSDNDKVPDKIEGATADTDNDGTPNYRDNDDDGDGVLTVGEDRNGNGDPTDDDSDHDGISDYLDPDPVTDFDGDGIPDAIDTDDDNDGIPDVNEGNGTVDTDGDGTPDSRDTDSDGDGIPDKTEGTSDPDGDGIPNYLDPDSDGDGIPDKVEGISDTDGDGIPNYLDPDSDGDGIPDKVEGTGDVDGDGIPNYLDLDSDGDGIPDSVEGAGDSDGDGIPNFLDPDPTVSVQQFKAVLPIVIKPQ